MRYEVISKPTRLEFPKVIAVDTEYSEKNIRKAELLSISVGVSPDLTYIIEDFKAIHPFLENAEIIFAWNMVVDWWMLDKSGFKSNRKKWVDGMLMEHLVDERLDHGLGDFALREYDDDYKNEFWGKYSRYQDAPVDETRPYEMRDGCYTYRAGVKYLQALKDRGALVEHVHRLQWALFETEVSGISVDLPLIQETKNETEKKINTFLPRLREEFRDYCQTWELEKWKAEIGKRKTVQGQLRCVQPVFSFNSDPQLSRLLYGLMDLPVIATTKKRNPSVSSETLQRLAEDHPQIKTLVEYKETKALYSTFMEGMLDRVEDSRIYPGFFINGTTTGRISHNNPNMGNLPRGGNIRSFFRPDPGHSILGADYSQLEVVVEANLTEDPQLLKIILEGASKHDITAQGLGIPRDQAKTLNFALQYGAGIPKISKLLGISIQEGTGVYNRYWELYSGVWNLKMETSSELERQGFVTNLFGRIRHFNEPKNEYEKAKQERQAYNFKIQGVGADITNRATYLVAEEFQRKSLGRLLFSVHDELVTEVNQSRIEEGKNSIVSCMAEPSSFLKLKYPVESKLYGPFSCWRKA